MNKQPVLIGITPGMMQQHLHPYTLHYKLTDGSQKHYEIVSRRRDLTEHTIGQDNNGVILLVFNQEGTHMLLAEEFRMGVNTVIINQIAGLQEPGETPAETAARELREETGITDIHIMDILPTAFSCAPISDMKASLVICTAAGNPAPSRDPKEPIRAKWYSKSELKDMIRNQTIQFSGRAQAFAYAWTHF